MGMNQIENAFLTYGMERLQEQVEQHPELFPEYSPANIALGNVIFIMTPDGQLTVQKNAFRAWQYVRDHVDPWAPCPTSQHLCDKGPDSRFQPVDYLNLINPGEDLAMAVQRVFCGSRHPTQVEAALGDGGRQAGRQECSCQGAAQSYSAVHISKER